MERNDLESLKHFIDTALSYGWAPSKQGIQSTDIVLDPACVRLSVPSPSQNVDNDIYCDWLTPLYDPTLAQAAWGKALVAGYNGDWQVAWRYHQHRLLDFLQGDDKAAYFEYLSLVQ